MTDTYRKATDISDEEWLGALTHEWQSQLEIFVSLGGHPDDHNYALLSRATWRLRRKGHQIDTRRPKPGVRLAEGYEP